MSTFTPFAIECLEAHNRYRREHNAPPLQLNQDLCNYAQEWAQYLAARNFMQHRQNHKFGENLYMCSGMQARAADCVKSWYDEVQCYNFNMPGFSMNTGHFTQVVWRNSRQLGVGIATRGNATYVVANYDPPGNYHSQYHQNVLPKCF